MYVCVCMCGIYMCHASTGPEKPFPVEMESLPAPPPLDSAASRAGKSFQAGLPLAGNAAGSRGGWWC